MKKGMAAVLSAITGGALASASVYNVMNKEIKKEKMLDGKNEAILKAYSRWVTLKQEGKSIAEYLKENGYRKVAIYGMHYLGENLYNELKNTDIEIKYAIDRNAANITSSIPVYTPDEALEEVDAVIVTAFYFYADIEGQLGNYLDCPILSLEDILFEM